MLRNYIILFLITSITIVKAQEFTVVDGNSTTQILLDKSDAEVIRIATDLFVRDVQSISGKTIGIVNKIPKQSTSVIIAGTLESKFIQQLRKNGKINASNLKDTWENYSIQQVDAPFKGIETALVITGSDRRGAAYGILELSRKMGVSPWEWWADVTPKKQATIKLATVDETFKGPSVKYRGVFLNDEDWGLERWATLTFEPEASDMGPKTYAKIFELLLRLRANTIWPAMHSSTEPFYSFPDNKKIADDYAIVIGTSHAEPMLSNINTEWDRETMGEYRYDSNSATIKKLFTDRAVETSRYEGIYTMGMRGEHDSPMIMGDDDTDAQVKLLGKVITDQRTILEKELKKPAETVPQAFVPYKEVLNYYQSGLVLPDDITLVWTDDNYGYIRQLSTHEEQQRSGGAGVYYHTSYWGRPHDYLWLNSTNPVLMWEEMTKAYS
ncbi:MAG: glycosyl hydrolase 115 family protein, partial [Maribacter sp.]